MKRHSDHALAFMAKWPEPGRAKTRLTPELTPAQAAELARAFLLDMLAEAGRVPADRWLAFAPECADGRFRSLAGPGIGLLPADLPNFGAALWMTQRRLLGMGYQTVSLVASDVPHLPAQRYLDAFEVLRTADVALGPCGDGGYYLLAASSGTPSLFDRIAWSTANVFGSTMARAAEAGLVVGTLAPCDDVDTPPDLEPLRAALRARPGAGHTLRALDRVLACEDLVHGCDPDPIPCEAEVQAGDQPVLLGELGLRRVVGRDG